MRTTIEIPDALFIQVKARAALRKSSMKDLLIEALEEKLTNNTSQPRKRIQLPLVPSTKPGSNELTAEKIESIESITEANDAS